MYFLLYDIFLHYTRKNISNFYYPITLNYYFILILNCLSYIFSNVRLFYRSCCASEAPSSHFRIDLFTQQFRLNKFCHIPLRILSFVHRVFTYFWICVSVKYTIQKFKLTTTDIRLTVGIWKHCRNFPYLLISIYNFFRVT